MRVLTRKPPQMNRRRMMTTLCTGEISLPSCSFSGALHFFRLTLKVDQKGDHLCLSLEVEKGVELGEIAMLAETRIRLGNNEFFLDRDLWSCSEVLWSTGIPVCTGPVTIEARMVDLLAVSDITERSRLRKLQVLCYNQAFYVDIRQLTEIGGYLFMEWRKAHDEGHGRVVVTMDGEDLKTLLEAVVKYDFITIHRRNYQRLCEIGEKYRILPLLRSIEQYLMEANIHPMRRLELSVEMRMARLYDMAIREMGPPHMALEKLHDYLNENGETLFDVHPKLLAALHITPEYICIS